MIAGGAVYIEICVGGANDRGLIQNQTDSFYISGHGIHAEGTLCGVSANQVDWRKDLDEVFMAGCSVLDIDNLNNNPTTGSPGLAWAVTGPGYLLGYNWTAPTDTVGSDPFYTASIIRRYFVARLSGASNEEAWRLAHEDALYTPGDTKYNACVIRVADRSYFYFKKGTFSAVWTQDRSW